MVATQTRLCEPRKCSGFPEIQQRIASGHTLTSRQEKDEYRKIVQAISPSVGDAGVSIEVFADLDTSAEEMLAQGEEMFSWIPNAYIKYPCTHQGLKAAEMSVRQRIRVNMTLCFSQEQAAAVYAATKESRGDGHVHVLAASIRHLDHLLASFALDVELVPAKVLEKWTTSNFPLPALACLMHEGGRSHVIGMNGGLKEGWQEPILDWSRC